MDMCAHHLTDPCVVGRVFCTAAGTLCLWRPILECSDEDIQTASRSLFPAAGGPEGDAAAYSSGPHATCIRISAESSIVSVGLSNGDIPLWDPFTGQVVLYLSGGHSAPVLDMVYGPPPLILSVSADGSALLWDKRTGNVASALRAHTAPVGCGAVSVSGLVAATGDAAGTILLWDLRAPGRPRLPLVGHGGGINAVHLFERGHSGAVLSASADWTARIWNPSNGRLEATLAGALSAGDPLCHPALAHEPSTRLSFGVKEVAIDGSLGLRGCRASFLCSPCLCTDCPAQGTRVQ